jgi:hypothetical protein
MIPIGKNITRNTPTDPWRIRDCHSPDSRAGGNGFFGLSGLSLQNAIDINKRGNFEHRFSMV